MKVLFIGGTGLISSACSELALERGVDLFILNRGQSTKYPLPEEAHLLAGDVHGDETAVEELLAGHAFDVVVDWIAFHPQDIERDLRLFNGRTGQFVFISSASAYQKPPRHYLVTEETPLENPYWEYSRDKMRLRGTPDAGVPGAGLPGYHRAPIADLWTLANPALRRQLAASLYPDRPDEARQAGDRSG